MSVSTSIRRGALCAAIAVGVAIAAPAAASAHVGVDPDRIPAQESTLLTFSFTHGCKESPTTALRITMPEGVGAVSPTFDSGWDVDVEKAENGLVTAVTYTAVRPVPIGLRGAVSLAFRPGQDAPQSLAFPIEQRCESGSHEWTQLAEKGQNPHDLDAPAPVVTLLPAEGASAAEHGASGHGEDEQQAGSASADPVPVALGATG
ncbi:MAG: DUF1775 domain-containing protein, partial [Microbacterium sp.]